MSATLGLLLDELLGECCSVLLLGELFGECCSALL